jgi:threonine/homoserine/homoserine lactone efflux protein
MPTPETSLAFFPLAVLLALAPGPDNLFVLMITAAEDRRAGFAVVAGLMLGVMGHTLAVALGLAALLAASAAAFTALKLAGAAYLLYLAWGAWRAPPVAVPGGGSAASEPAVHCASAWRLVGRGVVMNLTNPKVLLFFLALLPQFVVPERGPVALQMTWLGLLFIVAGGAVFCAVVLAAGALRAGLLRSARAQRWLHRAAAGVFVALAVRLALAQR